MTINVKDGGTFREVNQVYVHDGTSFTNKTITNAYVKDGGVWREIFTLFNTLHFHKPRDLSLFQQMQMLFTYDLLLEVDLAV